MFPPDRAIHEHFGRNHATRERQFAGRRSIKRFYRRIATYPQPAQELIADLSSIIMEADVHKRFKDDSKSIDEVKESLFSQGLTEQDVRRVMGFFGLLPVPERKSKGRVE